MLITVLGVILLIAGTISAFLSIVAFFTAGAFGGTYFAILAAFSLYCGICWTKKPTTNGSMKTKHRR